MRPLNILNGALLVCCLALVSGGVVLAVDPARQIAELKNARRQQDVERLASALAEYALDHGNNLPVFMAVSSSREICVAHASGCSGIDVSALVDDGYLDFLPVDPDAGPQAITTGYVLTRHANMMRPRLTVTASLSEKGGVIEAHR